MPEKTLVRRMILQNTLPGHNKYYEISIYDLGGPSVPNFLVDTRWGRIENFQSGNAQSQEKGTYSLVENAHALLGSLSSKKRAKGYTLLKDQQVFASQSVAKRVTIQAPEKKFERLPDRTELQESGNWWASVAGDAIEERTV